MRYLFFLLLCINLNNVLVAQDNNSISHKEGFRTDKRIQSIDVGYGLWGLNRLTKDQIRHTNMRSGEKEVISGSKKNSIGGFYIGYKQQINVRSKEGFGIAFHYERTFSDAFLDEAIIGEFKDDYYSFIVGMRHIYTIIGKWLFYFTMDVAGTLNTQSYKDLSGEEETRKRLRLNFQLSPVGIRYGKRAGMYTELGFGGKGILSFGLFVNL